jgi:RNA polymerase sigma factor (sigma-70 family)
MGKNDPLSEEALIEIAQTGSRHEAAAAWEQLLLRHSSHLFASLACRGFVSVEQQDIASETWLRAWRKISQYKYNREIGFFPWLRAISDFVIKEHFKKQYRNPLSGAEDVEIQEETLSDGRTFELNLMERLNQAEFRKAVEEILVQAPMDYKKLIEARFFCGFEPQEIAELCDWSTNKVYITTYRAIDWLRRTLIERFGTEGPEIWYV